MSYISGLKGFTGQSGDAILVVKIFVPPPTAPVSEVTGWCRDRDEIAPCREFYKCKSPPLKSTDVRTRKPCRALASPSRRRRATSPTASRQRWGSPCSPPATRPTSSIPRSARRCHADLGTRADAQRRRGAGVCGDENRIGGSSFSKLDGLIYFPSETVYIDGNMSPDMQCTRFIARRLVFAGHVYIGEKCDGLDKVTFAVTEVRLIN